ncbi:hypothetical protein WA845_02715 [Agrobacterium sp. CMT1]|uniref:hypothetical protein n=1 Tax=Agrobacterium sp. CMT1 TaxID=3128901 RepID=UPI000DD95D67
MSRKELATVLRWTSWVTFQMLIAYRGGLGLKTLEGNPRERAEGMLYALDNGMRYFAQGGQPLRPMPDIPAVWPNAYPFELTWCFVEILQQRISEYPSLKALDDAAWQRKIEKTVS